MFYALSWFVVVSLLALWSLTAWALHGMATWAVSNAGALSLPAWLSVWVPPEWMQAVTQWTAALGPLLDSLLQAAPVLASGLGVVAWVIWGLGSALLVLMGIGLHLLIALWRRRSGRQGPGAGAALAAD